MSNVLRRIFHRARGLKAIRQVSALVLALSTPVVAPVGAATITIGTSDPLLPNCIPLGCPAFFDVSRYQQVYSASAFSGISAPIVITEISFFHTTQFGRDLANATFTIFLSSTLAVVNSLSTTLDDNVGGDNTQFAILTTAGGAAPNQLNILGTGPAFVYDPTSGSNLLIDMFLSGVGSDGLFAFFDADPSGTQSSRAFVVGSFGDADEQALVTMFTYEPFSQGVPEPGTLFLLGASLLGVWTLRRSSGPSKLTWRVKTGWVSFKLG